MQIKTTILQHYTPSKMAKKKKKVSERSMLSASESVKSLSVEQSVLHYTAGEIAKWHGHFEKQLSFT